MSEATTVTAAATRPAKGKPVTLLERADALRIIEDWVREHEDEVLMNEGALPDELAALLEQADGDFDTKMERVAIKRRDFQAHEARAKAEKDYYAQRAKMWGNADEALRRYQHTCLSIAGRDRVKTALATVWLQNSPPAVRHTYQNETLCEIADASLVMPTPPPEDGHPLAKYVTVELVAKLDTRAVLADWKARKQELEVEAETVVSLTTDEEEGIRLNLEIAAAEMDTPVDEVELASGIREALDEALLAKRADYVAGKLATEFPGITVEQHQHVRQS